MEVIRQACCLQRLGIITCISASIHLRMPTSYHQLYEGCCQGGSPEHRTPDSPHQRHNPPDKCEDEPQGERPGHDHASRQGCSLGVCAMPKALHSSVQM